ncbi:nucleoside deaminase [Limnoglobus roseus]|uniref:Nucleoside deaminase n=1 Tax=Limnoglobus roseus TaxID=2598579 RepID=A0A5C1AMN8_9BACT|nr:nucleoside deaminase [Limnoglobus roseus]QEL19373.1 nucleoside deaminase [Limnoglobus roseus]
MRQFEGVYPISGEDLSAQPMKAIHAMTTHEPFMRRCLELAMNAREKGNTPVGSVVVLDGTIIGEGIETLPAGTSITGHAELLACQAAIDTSGRKHLAGAVLYTTAEPCFMCGYAIRQLRVSLVIYGMETPLVGAVTSAHPILTGPALDGWRPAPVVIGGVLRAECEGLKAR